jgi:hypothetical protein
LRVVGPNSRTVRDVNGKGRGGKAAHAIGGDGPEAIVNVRQGVTPAATGLGTERNRRGRQLRSFDPPDPRVQRALTEFGEIMRLPAVSRIRRQQRIKGFLSLRVRLNAEVFAVGGAETPARSKMTEVLAGLEIVRGFEACTQTPLQFQGVTLHPPPEGDVISSSSGAVPNAGGRASDDAIRSCPRPSRSAGTNVETLAASARPSARTC